MKLNFPTRMIGIFGLAFLATEAAYGNTLGPLLPGAAQPDQVSRALKQEQVRPTAQTVAPVSQPDQAAPSPLGEQAKKIKFQLNGIIIEGNTIYSDAKLNSIFKDKVNKTITVAELFEIVQGITNYYRNNGYIISRAILPPQHVKGGIVKIQVIEGYIGKVDVGGDPKGAKCLVQAYGNQIKKCRPLKIDRMERYLLIANETPGTEVKAVLAPSKSETGAADLTLMTNNRPVTGYLSYDNYGTRYIGPQQDTANGALNSIIASGDSLQATMTQTPVSGQLNYRDINYNLPIKDTGQRWILGSTRAGTRPQFVLTPLNIQGLNQNWYTSYIFPVIRSRTENLTAQLSFNYLNTTVNSNPAGQTFNLYSDYVRNIGLNATYNFADRFFGSNVIFGEIRKGLPIFGYSSNTSFAANTSRPGGKANYTKIDAYISRVQSIRGPWSLYGILKGQKAYSALLASEQFTFGGPLMGRGYDVAELIGDQGFSGTLELRYDKGYDWRLLRATQFYAYYDIGKIYNYYFIGGVPTQVSAASAGGGVRFYFTRYISGNLMVTQPLTKPVSAQALVGKGKDYRGFFSIVASFG